MGTKHRYREAEAAAKANLLGNAGLALLKGVTGLMTGSAALLSDAVRSASDAAVGATAVTGLRRIGKSQGKRTRLAEPGRAESVTRFIAAVVLVLLGLEIAITAVRSVAQGIGPDPHWASAAIIIFAFGAKQWFLPVKERGTDLFASLLALIGTGGAYAGKLLSLSLLYYLDPAAAFAISLIVLQNGYKLIATTRMTGYKPGVQQAETDELMEAVQRIDGVVTIEELNAWEHGHYVAIHLRISVNPRITVQEGNEIAKRVKELLMKRFLHVADVTVSVEPYAPGYPYKSNHDPNQEDMPTLLQ
ncbi:cation diffusion facilitator family transporter [Paenibacillus tarimensis]